MSSGHIPAVPRPKTPIITGVPGIVDEDDEDEDPAIVPRRLYFADSMQVLNINMVYSCGDLIPEYPQRSFRPVMVHQVFEGDGIIYGYRNLNIDLYFLANSAKCYVDLQYTEVTSSDTPNHSAPDDIIQKISPWLPEDYFVSKKLFMKEIEKENIGTAFGTAFDSVQLYHEKEKTAYEYTFTACDGNDPEFKKFHSRFQCMIVWFIDGASQIDLDDPNWMFVYVYETKVIHGRGGVTGVFPVGFATIYKFFHYPDKVRTRISQLFVIPPCQGMGIGTHLLKNAYHVIRKLDNVVDITVEEPCPSFTRMRDLLDCRLLMYLEPFKKSVINHGFTNTMYEEANKHYKINKRQIRRVYEILRFAYINCNVQDSNYLPLCKEISDRLEVKYTRDLRLQGNMFNAPPSTSSKLTESIPYMKANIKKYLKEIMDTAQSFNKKYLLSSCNN